MKAIKFTNAEISHILNLLEQNELQGWYVGNLEHYRKRAQSITSKILKPNELQDVNNNEQNEEVCKDCSTCGSNIDSRMCDICYDNKQWHAN